MDRTSLGLELNTYMFTLGSLGNLLPFGLVFLTFLTLFNRLFTSLLLTLSIAAILYFISFTKNNILGKPLSGDDFIFLSHIDKSTISLFSSYINPLTGALAVTAAVIAFLLVGYFDKRFFQKSKPRVFLLFILASVFSSTSLWVGKVYEFNTLRFSWSEQLSSLHAGLVSKIIFTEIKSQEAMKEPINDNDINHVLSQFHSTTNPNTQSESVKPDIIIIQSESFFDPAIITNAPEAKGLLPNYYAALDEGKASSMSVPTFGGGTIRTEYELLTGIPMAAFPQIQFPYLQIRKDHFNSLATATKSNGYATTAIHGNSGSFWNRKSFFKKADFDKFLTSDDFPATAKKDGYFLSDSSMTDVIIDQLNSQNDKYKFIFAISIEGHGPYDTSPVFDPKLRDSIPSPKGLSKNAEIEYKNYLYHMHNADKELGRLTSFLNARGKPYILVFYGDHLPGFTTVYNEITFNNQLAAKDQKVPVIIYSQGVQITTKPENSWSLGSRILKDAGLKVPRYFDVIANMGDQSASKEDQSAFLSVARLQFSEGIENYKYGVQSKK